MALCKFAHFLLSAKYLKKKKKKKKAIEARALQFDE